MRKAGIIWIIALLCLSCTAIALQGSGTPQDPYNISSCDELNRTRDDLFANYSLVSDINCDETKDWDGGAGWLPISSYSGGMFKGDFNGNNHKIVNLTSYQIAGGFDAGFLGSLSYATVHDFTLENAFIYNDTYNSYGGGIAAWSEYSNITNVHVSGNITIYYYGGLLIGRLTGSRIINCSAHGYVNDYAYDGAGRFGGLIGYEESASYIGNSWANATVTSQDSSIGGLVGYSDTSTITDSHSIAYISGTYNYIIGGLVGEMNGGEIDHSYSSAEINCLSTCGGLVGRLSSYGTISNSYSEGNLFVQDSSGGLVGVTTGYISNSYSESSITAISGTQDYIGGLIGGTGGGIINNSYSKGNVSGLSIVGGLVGELSYDTNLTNSYSISNVSGTSSIGGLVALHISGTCINNFWDNETSGQLTDNCTSGSLPKTTSWMKTRSTFTGAGWNFNTIWGISPSANDGYPYLKWQRFGTQYSAFPGSTDFLAAANPNNVTSAVLQNSMGSITWVNGINVNGADFDSNSRIEMNLISLNFSALDTSLNTSATVTMNVGACQAYFLYYSPNYHATQADLIADPQKVECITGGQCTNVQCNGGIVTFDVTHFDTYGSNGGVPEFSTITLMLALAITLAGFIVIRKRNGRNG